jgi:chromosome segregation ATPase
VADHLALAGVELDSPRAGHLPKYPETQRSYGVLDLNADQLDQVAQLQREVEQWKHRHETQRQALEAMRGRAIQAETQLEVEQHKVQQLQQELQQLREGQ